MRIYKGFDDFQIGQGSAVTVGSFDGVHRGHQLLLAELIHHATHRGLQSVVVTFDPHPRQVLKGNNRLLTTLEQKLELLERTGVDTVVVINFTVEFSKMPYDIFVRDILLDKLGARLMVVGSGHHFGSGGRGDKASLEALGLKVVFLERYDNISSTAIRDAIDRGDTKLAHELLGR